MVGVRWMWKGSQGGVVVVGWIRRCCVMIGKGRWEVVVKGRV